MNTQKNPKKSVDEITRVQLLAGVLPWIYVHRLVCVFRGSCEGVEISCTEHTADWSSQTQRKSSSIEQQSALFIPYSVDGVALRPSGRDQVAHIVFEWLSPVASAERDIVDWLLQSATWFKRDFKWTGHTRLNSLSPPYRPTLSWINFP